MLAERIRTAIRETGPMRLDRYIGICLYDQREGYYATRAVFGRQGDFTTAPEISQIFGEIVGLWILNAWGNIGTPSAFRLIELGAGRGTLMADAMRVARRNTDFDAAVEIAILENSPRRRDEQRQNINYPIIHLDHLRDLDKTPSIFFANEFFDALPIRQFRNEGGGWLEAFVDEHLAKIWQPIATPPRALLPYHQTDGIIEWNENSAKFAGQIAAHLARYNGAFLAIDYGDWDGAGDTLQALEDHKFTDPFAHPGHADITAHVRFSDLAHPFETTSNFATQREFLTAFGASARRDQLITSNPTLAAEINAGYDRLTAPDQMGELFKVLAIEVK